LGENQRLPYELFSVEVQLLRDENVVTPEKQVAGGRDRGSTPAADKEFSLT
jgi:hypothetical protein